MSKVLVSEDNLSDIADSIRTKLGIQTTYKPGQMSAAIDSITTGLNINGVIKKLKTGAGSVSAGDFVNFNNAFSAGTDTTIDTSYLSYGVVVALSSTKVFIAYRKSNAVYGCVCTINDDSIQCGSSTQLSSNIGGTGSYFSAVTLSSTKVFVAFCDNGSNYLKGLVCTIDGTSITSGTITQMGSSAIVLTNSVVKLSASKVFIAYSAGSSRYLYGIVCTISDTTITAGTATSLVSTSGTGTAISSVYLDSTHVFVAHKSDSTNGYLNGIICKISGTTITKSSDFTLYSTNSNTTGDISAVKIRGALNYGTVFIGHTSTSYVYGTIVRLNFSNNTIITTYTYSINSRTSGSGLSLVQMNDSLVAATYANNNKLTIVMLNIWDDNYFNIYGSVELSDNTGSGHILSSVCLNTTDVFVAHSSDGSDNMLSAQIARRTVTKATTSIGINGIAKNSAGWYGGVVEVITL